MQWKLSMEKGTHSNSHKVQKKEEQQNRPRGLSSEQFPLAQPFLSDWDSELVGWGRGGTGHEQGRLESRPEACLSPWRALDHQLPL